eukprot:gnl/TRDRNA2_/TRDRNA2_193247_c0_seq1.p1 gnl/TRDRNA2_/TRDRNA2_193247_c0~~gnl/TRDRNA2_/TRDRNA2_193247_c0_seq1.p1  ORF type:complete len:198 (+),score=57.29 gnl/TRDRNA2_/TRDRNA2_193247_c0_seq1:80-673(+)
MMFTLRLLLLGAAMATAVAASRTRGQAQAAALKPLANASVAAVQPAARANASMPELKLSPAARTALRELLVDLDIVKQVPDTKFVPRKRAQESKEDFMPRCEAHVKRLVNEIDRQYTDAQLETVLRNECQQAKEFPNTHDSGFKSHEQCIEFAKKLTKCRMHELETGDDSCYTEFCSDYYDEVKNVVSTPKLMLLSK